MQKQVFKLENPISWTCQESGMSLFRGDFSFPLSQMGEHQVWIFCYFWFVLSEHPDLNEYFVLNDEKRELIALDSL